MSRAWAWALAAHMLGWYMQIHPGHLVLEKRKPALMDSFLQVPIAPHKHARHVQPLDWWVLSHEVIYGGLGFSDAGCSLSRWTQTLGPHGDEVVIGSRSVFR